MKVKRKVAALLALAMVVTGQPSGVLADGLNTLGTSYAAENSDAATGSEATDPTEPEKPELPEEELPEESTGAAEEPSKPEEETPTEEVTEEETEETKEETKTEPREEEEDAVYSVSYTVEPKGSAEIKGKEEVKEGKDLTFKVYPEEGYEIESVEVNGEEVTDSKEKKSFLFFFGDTYYEYKVQDVEEDLDIAAYLKQEEVAEEKFTLVAEDGETKVTIQEKDADALKNVASVEITELEEDEAIEAALQDQVKEGDVSDYKAIDITLYDEDGNEVKPEGEVSVTVEGVSTDEDYDEVAIFHLQEKVMPKRNNAPAANGISRLSEEEQPQAYVAEEVDRNEKDEIGEGPISFTTDHFSTYVITFIKSPSEYTNVTVNLVSYENEAVKKLNYTVSDMNISLGEDEIEVSRLVSIYKLYEFQDEKTFRNYAYQYATWDDNPNSTQITKISYSDFTEGRELYFWYAAMDDLQIPVIINIDGIDRAKKALLDVGEFDYTDAQKLLQEAGIEGTFAYENAKVVIDESNTFEIESVTQINGDYYVRRKDDGTVEKFDPEAANIVFYFKSGYTISFEVTGAGNNPGNTVDNTQGNSSIDERQIAAGEERVIPIGVAQGYQLKVTKIADGKSEVLHDPSEEIYQIRNYSVVLQNVQSDITIKVEFVKLQNLVLEYGSLIKNGNWIENLHNSVITGINLSGSSSIKDGAVEITIKNSDDFTSDYRKYEYYVMDTFAINGQSMNIPDEPNGEGERFRTSKTSYVKDENNENLAIVEISAEKDSEWVWEDYIYQKEPYILYTIRITNIKSNLVITAANLHGINAEAVLHYDENQVSVYSGEKELIVNELLNPPINLRIVPEFGYYVTQVKFDGQPESFADAEDWYKERNYLKNTFSGGSNPYEVEIVSEPIYYQLKYGELGIGNEEPFTA